jgi:hypothetical protein
VHRFESKRHALSAADAQRDETAADPVAVAPPSTFSGSRYSRFLPLAGGLCCARIDPDQIGCRAWGTWRRWFLFAHRLACSHPDILNRHVIRAHEGYRERIRKQFIDRRLDSALAPRVNCSLSASHDCSLIDLLLIGSLIAGKARR